MGRKRKIPKSFTLRNWYRGEISSDSDENEFLPTRQIRRVEPDQLPSEPTSDPISITDSDRPLLHNESSDVSSRNSLDSPLCNDDSADNSLLDAAETSPLRRDAADDITAENSPLGTSHDGSPLRSPLRNDSPRQRSPFASPQQSPSMQENSPQSNVSGETDAEPDEKDYFELLKDLSEQWLVVEITHSVSKSATNSFWKIAKEKFHGLFEAKQRQNVKKKAPMFDHTRRILNKQAPEVDLEIGYIKNSTGELVIEENLRKTPVKEYPPSEYTKAYEIASVKVLSVSLFHYIFL